MGSVYTKMSMEVIQINGETKEFLELGRTLERKGINVIEILREVERGVQKGSVYRMSQNIGSMVKRSMNVEFGKRIKAKDRRKG